MTTLQITYLDSSDIETTRDISDIELRDQHSIIAFCHIIQHYRPFRLKGIQSMIDLETGEIIPNPYDYFGIPEPIQEPKQYQIAPSPVGINPDKYQRTKERAYLIKHFRFKIIYLHYKAKFFATFDDQCFKCGSTENLNLDHHIPIMLGGHLIPGNLAVLCKLCNSLKHDKPPEDFYTEAELERLKPLIAMQNELFEFEFNWKQWNKNHQDYLVSIGIASDLANEVLTNSNHRYYIDIA